MHYSNPGDGVAFCGARANPLALEGIACARCPLGFVKDRALRAAARHWSSLLRNGDVPERRALDPAEMTEALPYVWLCTREAPGRYRMDLAGGEIRRLLGTPLRGRILADVLNKNEWCELEEKLEKVLVKPALHWSTGPIFEGESSASCGECLMMPLAQRGERAIVLGVTTYSAAFVRSPGRLCSVRTARVVALADLPRIDEHEVAVSTGATTRLPIGTRQAPPSSH